VVSGALFFIIGDSKQRLNQQLTRQTTRANALSENLSAAEADKETLREQVHELDAALAAAKRELDTVRDQAGQLQQALDLAEAARAKAEEALTAAQTQLAESTNNLAAARRELEASISPSEATRYRQTIVQLESRVAELENAAAQAASHPALVAGRANHAQVVGVGPQNAFVIINFGSTHGAVANQRLRLSRGTDTLAQVEISNTRENYSIAQVLPGTLSGKLRKGDAATLTP
jgi:uncharacterized phage infection (PIP) family protein YhgE